ncbi:MAG: hypothetical protein KC478_09665, partial [Bacteriovoracaceae bacterium]|nr:hypothetical protein [Bacteriovoracaceae bacterium]
VPLTEEQKLPSLSSLYKNYAELAQMCYDTFEKSEFLNRSNLAPKPKKSVEAAFTDSSSQEVVRFHSPLNIKGETAAAIVTINEKIESCRLHAGKYHEGLEARLNGRPVEEVANHLLKYDGYQGIVWSALFYRALEQGNEIEIPDKAQAIRIIFFELARVLEHLEYLAGVAYEAQAMTFYLKTLRWASRIESLQRQYSGNMYNLGILTYGGIHRDPPSNWISTCLKELSSIASEVNIHADKISKSSFWRQFDEVGKISATQLIEWGIQGPDLRASGINFDLRKRKPFYLYEELEFATPVGLNGNLYDRFLLRFKEIDQSIGIVTQILDNLPTSELVAREVSHFSQFNSLSDEQEQINYRASINERPNYNNESYYCCMEAASGAIEIFFSVIDGKVQDLKLGSDHLSKVMCLEEVAKGCAYENLGLLLKSMYINQKALEK